MPAVQQKPALVTAVAGTASNSYVSEAFADAYFANMLEWADWKSDAFTDADRCRALVSATANIDRELRAFGAWWDLYDYVDPEQKLMFPRSVDYNDSGALEIPDSVEEATCLLAMHLLMKRAGALGPIDPAEFHSQGISSVATGGLSVQTFGKHSWSTWPRDVRRLLSPFVHRGCPTVAGRSQPTQRKWWVNGQVAP